MRWITVLALTGAALHCCADEATPKKKEAPKLMIEVVRIRFDRIQDIPRIQVRLTNESEVDVLAEKLSIRADPELHLGPGLDELIELAPKERKYFELVGDQPAPWHQQLLYRALEHEVLLEVPDLKESSIGEEEGPTNPQSMAFKVRPIAPVSAILLSALSGVVFLLVFRWGVNHFIRKLPTPFRDYLQHGVMGVLVVTLAVLAFSVAPAKLEGLGLVVQPLDFIGGWLVGLSFTTLSQSFIAMFAPPGSNPVSPEVAGDSPVPPSG